MSMRIKKIMGTLAAFIMVVGMIASPITSVTAKAATETIPSINVQVPGCNTVFVMNNVSPEYGVYVDYNGHMNYYFSFPNRDGFMYCNHPADFEWACSYLEDNFVGPSEGGISNMEEDWHVILADWEKGFKICIAVDATGEIVSDFYDADYNSNANRSWYDADLFYINFVFGDCEGFSYDNIPWTSGIVGGVDSKELTSTGIPTDATIYSTSELIVN